MVKGAIYWGRLWHIVNLKTWNACCGAIETYRLSASSILDRAPTCFACIVAAEQ